MRTLVIAAALALLSSCGSPAPSPEQPAARQRDDCSDVRAEMAEEKKRRIAELEALAKNPPKPKAQEDYDREYRAVEMQQARDRLAALEGKGEGDGARRLIEDIRNERCRRDLNKAMGEL